MSVEGRGLSVGLAGRLFGGTCCIESKGGPSCPDGGPQACRVLRREGGQSAWLRPPAEAGVGTGHWGSGARTQEHTEGAAVGEHGAQPGRRPSVWLRPSSELSQ